MIAGNFKKEKEAPKVVANVEKKEGEIQKVNQNAAEQLKKTSIHNKPTNEKTEEKNIEKTSVQTKNIQEKKENIIEQSEVARPAVAVNEKNKKVC